MTSCSTLDNYVMNLTSIPLGKNVYTTKESKPLWRIMRIGDDGEKYYLENTRDSTAVTWQKGDNIEYQQFYFEDSGWNDLDTNLKTYNTNMPPVRDATTGNPMQLLLMKSYTNDKYVSCWNTGGNYNQQVRISDTTVESDPFHAARKLWCIGNFYRNNLNQVVGTNVYKEDFNNHEFDSLKPSTICGAMAVRIYAGVTVSPYALAPQANNNILRSGTIVSNNITDIHTGRLNTDVMLTCYLVLSRAPSDMFDLCKGANTTTADCTKICAGTNDAATNCRLARDEWCGTTGGLDTISDACVNGVLSTNVNYNTAREAACADLLTQNTDLSINDFLVKYPHCSCFLGSTFYANFLESTLEKNPSLKQVFSSITQGECIFPQCSTANSYDRPYGLQCPSLTVCLEYTNVDISGNVNGSVNVKQSSKCTSKGSGNGSGGALTGGGGKIITVLEEATGQNAVIILSVLFGLALLLLLLHMIYTHHKNKSAKK